MEDLLKAVLDAEKWLDGFTRYSYRDTFTLYRNTYLDLFKYGVAAGAPEEIAQRFVKAIDDHLKKTSFWKRGAENVNIKMMLVSYLSPMLLSFGDVQCREFAEHVSELWNVRYPKNTYKAADYDTILNGFRHSIMGIDLENKHLD